MDIERELGAKLKHGLKTGEPMKNHTSWEVGGPADYFVCPANVEELALIVKYSRDHDLPLFVFGNGTNLLVQDGGIRGLVVKIGDDFSYTIFGNDRVKAGAGTSVTTLACEAAKRGCGGFEFAAGIPGSLGGASIMNAGAFGGNIGEWILEAEVVNPAGEIEVIPRRELNFSYRSSNLPEKGIVTAVTLKITPCDPEEAKEKIERFMSERHRRHPALASAGSTFRNLADQPAGRLIESAGGKGMRVGGAEVSTQHANFIINSGGAKASDIVCLIDQVRSLVREKHGVDLHPEVKIVGEKL